MNLSLQQKYNKFALQLFQTGVLPNLSLLFDEFTFVYTPYVCLGPEVVIPLSGFSAHFLNSTEAVVGRNPVSWT